MMRAGRRQRILSACRDRKTWRQALLLGLPVGLLQVVLNQGDHWWRHQIDAAVVAKTVLSPLLSCSIALASAIATHGAKPLDPAS